MHQISLAHSEMYLQVLSKFEQDMAQAVEAFSKEQKRANQAEKEKQIQVNFTALVLFHLLAFPNCYFCHRFKNY